MKEKVLSTVLTKDQIALFYLGQAGFLIKFREKILVIDPYLSDSLDHAAHGGKTEWKRRYPSPIRAKDLNFADAVFLTHNHPDHADPETLKALAKVNSSTLFYCPFPIRERIIGYGIDKSRVIGLHTDTTVSLGDAMEVTTIPAAHEVLHVTESGDTLEVGYRFRLGDLTVYHSGDCCPYKDLEKRIMDTDIELLPINGRDYFRTVERYIIGCFDSTEAVTIAERTHAKLLIPMHFDLYDINSADPAYFVSCLKSRAPSLPFHIFTPGERFIY